jgi:hypothetical protein
VRGNGSKPPTRPLRYPRSLNCGMVRFQPVYVPSGTATSGRRIPATSFPSAFT